MEVDREGNIARIHVRAHGVVLTFTREGGNENDAGAVAHLVKGQIEEHGNEKQRWIEYDGRIKAERECYLLKRRLARAKLALRKARQ